MKWQCAISVLGPLGGIALLVSSTGLLDTFAILGAEMDSPAGGRYEADGASVPIIILGAVGACLLGLGMVAAISDRVPPTPSARMLLACAVFAFAGGAVLIAIGHSQPVNAFTELAMAEVVDGQLYLSQCKSGIVWLRVGYTLVLAGAAAIALARCSVCHSTPAPWNTATKLMLILTVGASALMIFAYVSSAFAASHFVSLLNEDVAVKPVEQQTNCQRSQLQATPSY
jgi:hypothetical protein